MNPFSTAFVQAVHLGHIVAVHLPDSRDPVPEDVLERLSPPEREHAQGLGGYRQVDWVGGRLALRQALDAMDQTSPALLVDDHGAPVLPPGVAGSVSHKRTMAVALAARHHHGSLGVDLEDLLPARPRIAERVLLPEEIEQLEGLPEDRLWTSIALRFSFKEAIYKALHPFVHRYVDFQEALVVPDLDLTARVELRLRNNEGPFDIEARYLWLDGRVLTMVRITDPNHRRPRSRKRRRRGPGPDQPDQQPDQGQTEG